MSTQVTESSQSNGAPPAVSPAPAATPVDQGNPAAAAPTAAPTQENTQAAQPASPGITLSVDEPSNVPTEPTAPTGEESKNFDVSAHLTGDPGMDLTMRYLSDLGFRPESDEIVRAVETGDFSLLEAKLAAMGDKARGWKEHLNLAKAHLEAEDAKYETHIAECTSVIQNTVGGAEEWDKICSWANGVATEKEKKSVNAMLTHDQVQAKAAAMYLNHLYQKAAGTVVEPQSPIQGAQPTTQAAHGALSPEEYRKAIANLVSRKGQYIDNDPEYKELTQRRSMYRG